MAKIECGKKVIGTEMNKMKISDQKYENWKEDLITFEDIVQRLSKEKIASGKWV